MTVTTTEKGAEGKPQLVIPGAERIGDGALAQRLANKPLVASKPQRAAGGLFSDEARQCDLIDRLAVMKREG